MNKKSSKDETIEIVSCINQFEKDLVKYRSKETNQVFNMTNIRAIVLHQSSEDNNDPVELITKLINSKSNPYHFVISNDGTIYQINTVETCLKHCRAKKYTAKATEYFGDSICPIYEDTEKTKHPEASPDNCTVSILLPYNNGEKMNTNVYNSFVKLCAYIINKYAKSLQATANILCDSEINSELETPKCFTDAEYYRTIKYDIEKKRSNWFVHYHGTSRGYCTEKIGDLVLEK